MAKEKSVGRKVAQMAYKNKVTGEVIIVTKPYHSLYNAKMSDGSTRLFKQSELAKDYKYLKAESKLIRFGGVLDTTRPLPDPKAVREFAVTSYERHI